MRIIRIPENQEGRDFPVYPLNWGENDDVYLLNEKAEAIVVNGIRIEPKTAKHLYFEEGIWCCEQST